MTTISDNSKVWVYLSDREFSSEEEKNLNQDLLLFSSEWKAHGTPLAARFLILKKRFIVIAVDEDVFAASGCSIDKQLQFIKATEQKYNLQLLNRLLVAYLENEAVHVTHSSKIPALLTESKINDNTTIFQTNISTGKEFNTAFSAPLKETWLAKFLVV